MIDNNDYTARPLYKGLEGTDYFGFLYQLVLISRYKKTLDDNDCNVVMIFDLIILY